MAYGIKYRAEYSNKKGDTITVNILKKDWTGAVTAIDKIKESVRLKYKPQDGQQVIGSELSFGFVTKDKIPFQELLTANYKDFKCEFQVNSIKQWTGWLIIDNITTSYFEYVYTFSLSFMDELGELDRYNVTADDGSEIAGENSLLWYIKNSLKHNGIPLDFAIALNTKEINLMTLATDNALAKSTLIADRFININSGKKEVSSAKDVVSEILKPFNCKIFQSGNKYWIVNELEVGSTIYYHNWADLLQSGTATNNNAVDISAKKFDKANELTKRRPLKRASATYKNKNIPANLIQNGDFKTTDTTFWTLAPAGTNTMQKVVVEGEMEVRAQGGEGNLLSTIDIDVEQKTDSDTIDIQFDYYLDSIVWSGSGDNAPGLEVQVVKPNGTTKVLETVPLGTVRATYTASTPVVGTGKYRLRFIDRSSLLSTYSEIEYRLDNVVFTPQAGEGKPVTFDRFYTGENTATSAIDSSEDNSLLLGDGLQVNDIGNLKVGGTLTEKWNTNGRNEGLNLQHLYLLNLLRLNQKFRNKLRLKVIADDFARIGFNNHIVFDGVRYLLSNYAVTYGPIHTGYEFELLELPTTEITYQLGVAPLRSVNGEEPASELNITEVDPTVPDHVKKITAPEIAHWNEAVKRSGDTMSGVLKMKGGALGDGSVIYIEFIDSGGTRTGYIGDGSTTNPHITIQSVAGRVRIDDTSGTGAVWHSGNLPFSVDATNNNIAAPADITAYSDARIKADIETIEGAAAIVAKLRGVRYRRTDQESNRLHVGVIAQEVKEVLPEVVHHNQESDRYSVNYGAMVAVLIEANKELMKRIENLERRAE